MKIKFFLGFALLLPITVFAASSVNDLLYTVTDLLLTATKLLAPLALLFFLYQLVQFIRASSEGAATLEKNKAMLIYSGIILFVMVGVWSIVGYVQQSIGIDVTRTDIQETPPIPTELP